LVGYIKLFLTVIGSYLAAESTTTKLLLRYGERFNRTKENDKSEERRRVDSTTRHSLQYVATRK